MYKAALEWIEGCQPGQIALWSLELFSHAMTSEKGQSNGHLVVLALASTP